eukprot:m.188650 g.188650  ORF g.188650 m.188650 type:complete len:603 (+) comp15424_c0_seq17:1752-3560(+)
MSVISWVLTALVVGYIALATSQLYALWDVGTCEKEPCLHPAIKESDTFLLQVFFSATKKKPTNLSSSNAALSESVALADQTFTINLTLPPATRNNGTLFAHVFLTPAGATTAPVLSTTARMTRFLPLRFRNHSSLLGEWGSAQNGTGLPDTDRPVTHLRPRLDVRLAVELKALPLSLPGEIGAGVTRVAGGGLLFHPSLDVDDFGVLRKEWRPVSVSPDSSDVPFVIEFSIISFGRKRLLHHIAHSTSLMVDQFGFSESDIDDVKALFTQTSLKVLVLTYAVMFLHVVFDFLAFKNDYRFWKGRKDLAGLSRRTIFMNFGCSVIIFLYLLDSEQTSIIVLASTGVSLILDGWKVTKALRLTIEWRGVLPAVSIGSVSTRAEQETEQFDLTAMKFLAYALYPIAAIWAGYSLFYHVHKSWYSWLVECLANGVYMFGFVLMTPQLFINYRLKSVAHLPLRVFMYKAFNTFIDDVFSFIVHMPLTHRIACLRDDLVFFIYLYQRWLYPVDHARVNEYGYCYDDGPAGSIVEEKEGSAALAADERENVSVSNTEGQHDAVGEGNQSATGFDPLPDKKSVSTTRGDTRPMNDQNLKRRKGKPVASVD